MDKKKLFVSCPMRGRTEEAIISTMGKMHKIAEIVFEQELDLIDSYDSSPLESMHPSVYYLGKSLSKMASADYYIGIDDMSDEFFGCHIENEVAKHYGIESFLLPINFLNNFDDIEKDSEVDGNQLEIDLTAMADDPNDNTIKFIC